MTILEPYFLSLYMPYEGLNSANQINRKLGGGGNWLKVRGKPLHISITMLLFYFHIRKEKENIDIFVIIRQSDQISIKIISHYLD